MPGGHRNAGGSVLRRARVATEPVQRGNQPLPQPRRRPITAHVHREIEQPRHGIDVAVMTQQLIHQTAR